MKEKFPGYEGLTSDEERALWNSKDTLFVLDLRFLLSLFVMEGKCAHELIKILKGGFFKNKIWEPYDVCMGYYTFRDKVIQNQQDNINRGLKVISEFYKTVSAKKAYPYLPEECIKAIYADIIQPLQEIANQTVCFKESDAIKEEIDDLVNRDMIGNPFNKAELDELCKRAEERTSNKSFPDSLLSGNSEKRFTYHDFVVWEEMILYANTYRKNIVMLRGTTDDNWFVHKEDNITTSPSLGGEFCELTRERTEKFQRFQCYGIKEFIEVAKKLNIISECSDDLKSQLDRGVMNPMPFYMSIKRTSDEERKEDDLDNLDEAGNNDDKSLNISYSYPEFHTDTTTI